jgi:CheY-like chemotaxis protein
MIALTFLQMQRAVQEIQGEISMKRKVLVVDDEHMVADTLAIIFEKHGFDCRVSYNGEEALGCAEQFGPELLLCDMSMPGMNGLEVASSVTEKFPGCRILLLTGHYTNLRSARTWARKHSSAASRILTKPVQPAALLGEADALLLG